MNLTVDELVAHVERLSDEDRELLLERLRQSSMAPMDADIEAAWVDEIDRRLDAIDRGEMRSIPWDEAKKRLGL